MTWFYPEPSSGRAAICGTHRVNCCSRLEWLLLPAPLCRTTASIASRYVPPATSDSVILKPWFYFDPPKNNNKFCPRNARKPCCQVYSHIQHNICKSKVDSISIILVVVLVQRIPFSPLYYNSNCVSIVTLLSSLWFCSIFLKRGVLLRLIVHSATCNYRIDYGKLWLACSWIPENWCRLLSSTRFSHVASRIHLHGFGVTTFRSKLAPPSEKNGRQNFRILGWAVSELRLQQENPLLWT